MARGVNRVIIIGNCGQDPEVRDMPEVSGSSSIIINEAQNKAFWSKVDMKSDKKQCWEWKGAKKPAGYGNVRINKKYLLAHRVAFEITTGKIPDGFMVCHVCDNPSCVNPSHLMLGTNKSNAADMLIKNRQKKPEQAARGVDVGAAKLNDKQVIEIRHRYSQGEYQYLIARDFGVLIQTIQGQTSRRL